MHEAGLLAAAVADALVAAGPGAGRPTLLCVRVRDPIHVAPESARLHAELELRARGWPDVPVEVTADPVECLACGVSNEARADHPFCAECGWPLPDRGGHAVEATVTWAPSAEPPIASAEPPIASAKPPIADTPAGPALPGTALPA